MFEQDKCCSRMCTAVCCNEVAARWILKVQNHLLVREKVASWFLWPMRPKIDKMLHQPLSPLMLCTASKKILQNNLNPKLIYACFFKEHFHISCDHKMFSVFISSLLYVLDTACHWMFALKDISWKCKYPPFILVAIFMGRPFQVCNILWNVSTGGGILLPRWHILL